MPQQDGTGPNGMGPKTGRSLGDCPETKESVEPKNRPGFGQRGPGRQGRGFWRRFRFRRNQNS